MNRYSMSGISGTIATLTLAGTLAGCYAEAYDTDYPPTTYVSTVQPVYYEGRPVYWYHDHWYYQDARGWRHYGSEPAVLRERRMTMARRPPPPPPGWNAHPAPPPPPPPAGGWRR